MKSHKQSARTKYLSTYVKMYPSKTKGHFSISNQHSTHYSRSSNNSIFGMKKYVLWINQKS